MIYESSQVSFREIQILVKIWANTRGALDSGGHEGDLWTQDDMKGFGHRQAQEGDLDTGQRKGSLSVHTSLKGCFGYGQVKKSVLGMGKR